ncbi:MAG: hypothetical protein ACJAWV_000349 [Flammeovirgaceae bacterium]|jgi:hypothetical protein
MDSTTFFTISGKVIDSESKETLPQAMLRLKNKRIGTVTNTLGEFDFHIPGEYYNDTIEVYMLGYYNYQIPIAAISNPNNFTALLDVRVTELDAVVIKPIPLNANQVLEKAIRLAKSNYPTEPFILYGYFRDSKKENNQYVSLVEAAVRIYDSDYTNAPKRRRRLLERVAIDQIRRSFDYTGNKEWLQKISKENSLKELLGSNFFRYQYGAFDLMNNTKFAREDDVYYNDKLLYVISIPEFPTTEIYIDSETYAIVRFHYSGTVEGDEEMVDENIKRVLASVVRDFEFQEYNNKMYLKYIKSEAHYQYIDVSTQAVVNTIDLYLELLVNQIQTEDVRKPGGNETMNKHKGLETQIGPYSQSFWRNYNIIKDTPLDEKLVKDLERGVSLSEQFKQQAGGN